MGGTVDDYIFADDIAVANDALSLFTTEIKVLWQSTNYRTLVDFVVSTHARAVKDTDEWENDATIAYFHIVLDIHKGEYLAIVAYSRLGADFGFGTDFACHSCIFNL